MWEGTKPLLWSSPGGSALRVGRDILWWMNSFPGVVITVRRTDCLMSFADVKCVRRNRDE